MWTPLCSMLHGLSPKLFTHRSPKSRYQSCSPGMNSFWIDTSFSNSAPSSSSKGSPSWARSPPKRSEEHTSELQSLMRTSYAVFCLKKKTQHSDSIQKQNHTQLHKRIHNN